MVNELWMRALGRELTDEQRDQFLYYTGSLFWFALVELLPGAAISAIPASFRSRLRIQAGSDAEVELVDLVNSLKTIPAPATANATVNAVVQRTRQQLTIDKITRAIDVGGRSAKIPSNPFDTGVELRAYAKAEITAMGGTPQGTLAS